MSKSFAQLVEEARRMVPLVSPAEARRLVEEEGAVVVDVRDRDDPARAATGTIPGALDVSAGMLAMRADRELPEKYRESRLQDRARPVITACGGGMLASLGARTLQEAGFERVYILNGGTRGWKAAGLPTVGVEEPR